MRSLLLACLALTPACLLGSGDITGDDQSGATCGDGVVQAGETCDDGNTASGDGCSSTCQTEQVNTPHVNVTVDKPTVTSDLNVDQTVTITATSVMGFSGNVTLAVSVADSTNAPITDWSTTLDNTTLALAPDGTATAKLTLKAMGDAAMLSGNIKVTASGAATPGEATIATTFNPVLSVTFADDGAGKCVYVPGYAVNTPYRLKAGRMIAVHNGSATLPFTVHVDTAITTFPHEQGKTAAGGVYMGSVSAGDVTTKVSFYCHNDGVQPADTVVDPAGAVHSYLEVVQ